MNESDPALEAFGNLWNSPYINGGAPVLKLEWVLDVIHRSTSILKSEETVLNISAPYNIVGDLHGNLADLLFIFKQFGPPPVTSYLFLGDYVDRGDYSVAVMTLLLSLLIKFPDRVKIIRGNHEFHLINRLYGFYDEIINTYGNSDLWDAFQVVFSYMPLGCILDEKIFCVHGGISPHLESVKQLQQLTRPITTYLDDPIVCDILWSDPIESKDTFSENRRGLGVRYSAESVVKFLKDNKLAVLVRAHQCVLNGVNIFAQRHGLTVFSSSNYLPQSKNLCGIIRSIGNGEVQLFSLEHDKDVSEQDNACLFIQEDRTGLHVGPRISVTVTSQRPKSGKGHNKRRRSRSESPPVKVNQEKPKRKPKIKHINKQSSLTEFSLDLTLISTPPQNSETTIKHEKRQKRMRGQSFGPNSLSDNKAVAEVASKLISDEIKPKKPRTKKDIPQYEKKPPIRRRSSDLDVPRELPFLLENKSEPVFKVDKEKKKRRHDKKLLANLSDVKEDKQEEQPLFLPQIPDQTGQPKVSFGSIFEIAMKKAANTDK